MPFPFMPVGMLTGALVLGAVFALAYVLVAKLDRAFSDVGGAIVGRLVAGFDDWSHESLSSPPTSGDRYPGEAMAGGRTAAPLDVSGSAYEEAPAVPVEPTRADRR